MECNHFAPKLISEQWLTRLTRFRWVACQLDVLAKCTTLHKLRRALRTLPRTLEETYARILLSIDEELRDDALKLLKWLAFSARPLALAEMAEVFAIDHSESIPRFDPDQRPRDPRDLLDLCSSLVSISYTVPRDIGYVNPLRLVPDSVSYSGMLSLAHLSVKEYLTSDQVKKSSVSSFHLDKKLSDTAVSQDCLAYILQFDTLDHLKRCTEASVSFGRYAAEFWIVHARSEDCSIQDNVNSLIESLFIPDGKQFINWVTLFDIDDFYQPESLDAPTNIAHPLYYASQMGLDEIVDRLLVGCNPTVVNLLGGRQGSALGAASAYGREAMVQLLLTNGADVNMGGGDFGSALASASAYGHQTIVQMLLENGADVHLAGGAYGSVLASASTYGCEAIVGLLLENGADANPIGNGYSSALRAASRYGHKDVVQLLLENGADVNAVGRPHESALAPASANGY